MEKQFLKNDEDVQEWKNARLRWDHDFDPDIIVTPCLVIFNDTESNGYHDVRYETFGLLELGYLFETLGNIKNE